MAIKAYTVEFSLPIVVYVEEKATNEFITKCALGKLNRELQFDVIPLDNFKAKIIKEDE